MSGIIHQSPNMRTGSVGRWPVGHVIQHKRRQHNPSDHVYLDSGTSWVAHGNNGNLNFNFQCKSTSSYLILEHTGSIGHSSTGGGYGFMTFCKDGTPGNRNTWGGSATTGYNDTYGHLGVGLGGTAGLYQSYLGRLVVDAPPTAEFNIGMAVRRAAGNWFYIHVGGIQSLSITEIEEGV